MADLEAFPPNVQTCERKKKLSINLVLRTVFHAANLVLCCYVSLWGIAMCISLDTTEHPSPIIKDLKYLAPCFGTNWNYAFQTIFLMLSLLHDVLEWLDKQNHHLATLLRYWRDVIFSSLVVPFTLFVSSMFWSVYLVDRELVFPKVYDDVVPWWFNHCVHTNISVVVLIETLLQARRRPRDFKTEIVFVIGVDVAYAIVYYAIYFFTHRWLYQVFGAMTWWQVCLYQMMIWLSSFVFYYLQFPINRLIHGAVEESEKEPTISKQVSTEEVITNGAKEEINVNEVDYVNTDLKIPPFSTKSWSIKYRSIRNQFENSHL